MTCTRHKMAVISHRVHQVSRGNGKALPKFVIYELGKCARCEVEAYRERGSVRAIDAREAARLSGLPESEWPAAAPSSKSTAITASLTSWPFPVSAHTDSTS